MDRREFIKSSFLSAAAISCFSLVGCDKKESDGLDGNTAKEILEGTYNLAIVCTSRTNSAVSLDSDDGSLKGELKKIISTGQGFVAIVLADGAPQSASTTVEITSTNETRRNNEINDDVNSVFETDFSAQTAEADVFKALSLANKELGKAPENGFDNLLVVFDTGIATKGAINFCKSSALSALLDPDNFIQELRDNGELTKFSNLDKVVWYGMGQTAEPQGEPSNGTILALQRVYRTVFEAAGVNSVEFKEAGLSAPADDLPSVSVVNLPAIALNDEGEPVKIGDSLDFDEENSSLTFTTGTSNFNDEAAAQRELQDYIDMLASSDYKATIYGYTDSTGSADVNQRLSQARAQSVADLLIGAGVKKSQLKVVGKGVSKKYKSDKKNRRVVIKIG